VTRFGFARAGLTAAISKQAATADAMATGREHRVIMAFPPLGVAPAAFIPRRATPACATIKTAFRTARPPPGGLKKDRAGETRPSQSQQEVLV
jgi:hypothetical protein